MPMEWHLREFSLHPIGYSPRLNSIGVILRLFFHQICISAHLYLSRHICIWHSQVFDIIIIYTRFERLHYKSFIFTLLASEIDLEDRR
jgi:hypothetical protein